jgi:hypothetical protein
MGYLPIDPRYWIEQTVVDDERYFMSRVHDALKRANAVRPAAARIGELARLPKPPGICERSAGPAVEIRPAMRLRAPMEVPSTTVQPPSPPVLKSHPPLPGGWVRRVLAFAGVRMEGPAPASR